MVGLPTSSLEKVSCRPFTTYRARIEMEVQYLGAIVPIVRIPVRPRGLQI